MVVPNPLMYHFVVISIFDLIKVSFCVVEFKCEICGKYHTWYQFLWRQKYEGAIIQMQLLPLQITQILVLEPRLSYQLNRCYYKKDKLANVYLIQLISNVSKSSNMKTYIFGIIFFCKLWIFGQLILFNNKFINHGLMRP